MNTMHSAPAPKSSTTAPRHRTASARPASSTLDGGAGNTPPGPRHAKHCYVSTWWEARFPWMLDVLAAMDPEPLGTWIARPLVPVRSAVEYLAQPVAAALEAAVRPLAAAKRGSMEAVAQVVRALPLPGSVRRWLWLEPPQLRDDGVDCAPLALRRQHAVVLPISIMAAVLVHAGVFLLWPTMEVAGDPEAAEELLAIELPPDIQIPPPPQAITRPATPVLAATAVDEDVTIAPTTFDEFASVDLPPPPTPVADSAESTPTFTPFTVGPTVLNTEEIEELMIQEYPPLLRQAGIGGTVRVWAYVDAEGTVEQVRVAQGSGHESLDATALTVAARIRCSPALNRDVAVPVWIQMPLEFTAR